MKCFGIGGQEMVTLSLAQAFVEHGHRVCICSFSVPDENAAAGCHKDVKFEILRLPFRYSLAAVKAVRQIIVSESVDIVVNQWGLPFVAAAVLKSASTGLNVRIVAVYHNDPRSNARIKSIDAAIRTTATGVGRRLLRLKRAIVRYVTSRSMQYVYNNSDRYVLLSERYVTAFASFCNLSNVSKVRVIPNPVTTTLGCNISAKSTKKENVILYVGRIDTLQKQTQRVIDVWSRLADAEPQWQLEVVGDGEGKPALEDMVKTRGIARVSFHGFQSPVEYYRHASMLLLTSDFEGFPLVLAEAMSLGVIPIVYDSFAALHDIIDDGENGIIVRRSSAGGFDANNMAEAARKLMEAPTRRQTMSDAARLKSRQFSIDNICRQWEKLFDEMFLHGEDTVP